MAASDRGAAPGIVAIGEPLFEFSQVPGDSERYLQGFGGDTSNFTIAAARQGARSAYVTRLGADTFGDMFVRLWQAEGVDVSGVGRDPDAHTGVYFITHGASGHVFSYLRAGSAASRMRPEHVPVELVRAARFLHASGISQAISANACDAVFHAIATARSAGVAVSYDPNLRLKLWPLDRARAIIVATLPLADFFLPSLEDATALSGLDAPEAIVDWAHRQGAKVVLLKLGAEGVLASDGATRQRIAGFRVQSVDATGAGDCFDGALVSRLAAGDDLWAAARYANAAAALTTTGYGAVAPLPRPDAVRRLLSSAS